MAFWQQLLLLTFTPTATVAVLAYVLRSFFDQALNRDLERYKNELQLQRFEQQTKFSLIHQRRAEVISEYYKLLVRCIQDVEALVRVIRFDDGEPLSKKKNRVVDSFNEMYCFFLEHRLYFDESICQQIESLNQLIKESYIEFDLAQPGDKIEHGLTNDPDLWMSVHERVVDEVKPIKEKLESQFRAILEAKQEA